MSYPQITDYQDAVQDPRHSFSDPELKSGSVAVNPLGLPAPMSGGFVLTYTVQAGGKQFAVRCFHREIPHVQSRYAEISAKLRSLASPYFTNFDFQQKGILVRGQYYPIVKMDWVAGETLGLYLDRWASSAPAVSALRQSFASLAEYLERNGVAHGDIQNENVIVSGSAPRLIDYDGMYVPGMKKGEGIEIGHKHFQHPGRTTKQFGPTMDRFSFIVIDVSLEALRADATLHKKFREGGQAVIFKANDFADPSSSEIFRILNGMPALRQSATKLAAICNASIENVPTLADFVAGRNIPTAIAPRIGAPTKAPAEITYIGAFPVVDAEDFHAVLRRVGDKIELVGKIISIKEGIGKRGRGRGRPYVFINFGPWNGESAKITIWSEGLSNLAAQPNQSWVGKWISVTGLVEPPYEGKHYGRPYRNVGVTVTSDSQIIHIAEKDAKFRLGARTPGSARDASTGRNEDILKGIQGTGSRATGRSAGPQRTSTRSTPPKTRNEQILRGIQATQSQGTQVGHTRSTAPQYSPSKRTSTPSLFSRIPGWVWVFGFILLILFLSGRK